MKIDGKVFKKAGFGDGPVDAALNTIKEITGIQCTLTSYVVKAITGGTDAQGEVSVGVEKDGVRITGRGAHTCLFYTFPSPRDQRGHSIPSSA